MVEVEARRLETGFRPARNIRATRTAFHEANYRIKEICRASDMLAMVRGLRKCIFTQVRCNHANPGAYTYFCTPEAWASVQDAGDSTESESEKESEEERGGSESEGSMENSLDESTPVRLGEEVMICSEAFEELFGEDIFEWVTARALSYGSSVLTKEKAQLVGLTEAKRIEYSGTRRFVTEDATGFGANFRDIPMVISADRIFYFNGDDSIEKALPKGAEHSNLQPNCFYGSTMEEVRNPSHSVAPKWHMLLMYTLKRHTCNMAQNGTTEEETVLQDVGGQLELTLSSEKDHEYLDKVIRKCMEKPHHVWRSDNPWSRPPSPSICQYFDERNIPSREPAVLFRCGDGDRSRRSAASPRSE